MKDFNEIENLFDEGVNTTGSVNTPVVPSTADQSPPPPILQTQYTDLQTMIDEAVRRKFKKKKNKLERKIRGRLEYEYETKFQHEIKKLKKKSKKKKKSSSYDDLSHKFASVAIEKGIPKFIDTLLAKK